MTPKQVKQDLKLMARKAQTIAVLSNAVDLHNGLASYKAQVVRNEYGAIALDLINLELKYLGYIRRLNALQQGIIIDHYINGEQYVRISNKYHISQAELFRIVDKAIQNIANMSGYKAGQ